MGFAVVASEVRKLAERSQVAANEIEDLTKSTMIVSGDAGEKIKQVDSKYQRNSGTDK